VKNVKEEEGGRETKRRCVQPSRNIVLLSRVYAKIVCFGVHGKTEKKIESNRNKQSKKTEKKNRVFEIKNGCPPRNKKNKKRLSDIFLVVPVYFERGKAKKFILKLYVTLNLSV